MIEAEKVAELYVTRRRNYSGLHAQMEVIKAIYSGDVEIPLPDMDRYEKSYVPNLLQTGLDQMAGRVASVVPVATFSPDFDSRTARRKAETRRRVVTGWWQADKLPIKWKKRARHLLAYSASPVSLTYDKSTLRPTWNVRHPLTAFPSPDMVDGQMVPADALYAYRRTVGWLKARGFELGSLETPDTKPDDTITMLEYTDADCMALVAWADPTSNSSLWGESLDPTTLWNYADPGKSVMLAGGENPIGMVAATYPVRMGLEVAGQFDGMTGSYMMQAKMMALEILAVEKGIFPDTYLEGRTGEVPKFIDGPHDGRSGKVNVVSGGSVKQFSEQPGYKTDQMIDRLERSQRITSGTPAEFGGESATNIRTGRRGDAVLSAVIDVPIAEAQEVLAAAIADEDRIAIALSRHYDGLAPRTLYVGTGNSRSSITYISDKVFTHDCDHTVSYPVTGVDLNAMMIGAGQRLGMGIMSTRSIQEMDPFVSDPEMESDRITSESLSRAMLSGIEQQAASGQMPPAVVAKVKALVESDEMELEDAVTKAVEDYAKAQQEAQATQQQPAGAPPTPDQAASAAGMQSLAGAQMPGATAGQDKLASLLSTLRRPAQTVAPMRGAETGAM